MLIRFLSTEAILQYGGGKITPTPDHTPTPTPTQTPSPSPTTEPNPEPSPSAPGATEQNQTTIKTCEACDMMVTIDDEWHFRVTDGTGNVHYVECYGCTLNLIKMYETLHIQSYCYWYEPNYSITVDTTAYGAQVIVTPTTAIYLNGGSCDANRVAYNQTAADALKTDFSQYTSLFQQHDWAQRQL